MSVEDFDRDWKIDWASKTIFCLSPTNDTVYTVTDFWRWVRKEEASTIGIVYPHIVDTDGMGPSYNMPRKVKLTNAYSIDNKSLKFLVGTDSTLLDKNNNILVPDSLRKTHWWENGYIQGILILIAIVGLILTVFAL